MIISMCDHILLYLILPHNFIEWLNYIWGIIDLSMTWKMRRLEKFMRIVINYSYFIKVEDEIISMHTCTVVGANGLNTTKSTIVDSRLKTSMCTKKVNKTIFHV